MKPVFLAGALVLAAAGYAARLSPGPQYPRAAEIRYAGDSALEDAAFLSMGLRRLCADINFIRLMQYYGRAEEGRYVFHDHEHEHDGHHAPDRPITAEDIRYNEYSMYGLSVYAASGFEGGNFPQISRRALHILSLDPYFSYAALYAAGALAFNLNRADEALEILAYAKQYNPRDWKYDSYAAAIGYSKAGDPAKTADTLDLAVREPDCPTMLKQQTAFLNKKLGRWRRAYEIYADIRAHSQDPYYIRNAEEQMAQLRQKI
ncbi:MAG: hypothetical protein WC421_11665 [Elusimicrobiales bacterium]